MGTFWLAMLTALLWGLAPVFDKLGLSKASPVVALTIRAAVMSVGMSIFLSASGSWKEFRNLDCQSITFLVLAAVTAGLIGQLVYYYALKNGESGRVVPLVATYPLVALAISITYLKEPVTLGKITGAILIVLGVLVMGMDQTLWTK